MTQAGEKAIMHRRKQTPKEENEKTLAATPVVTFALLSVSFTDASGTDMLSKLISAARSKSEQQKLWGMAELFFQTTMGCIGRLIRVHGDLQPEGSYLILAPRVQLLPDMLVAAKNLLISCASFTTLQVQLQIGRSAVLDHLGMSRIAPSPFFDAKWTQYRNAPECTQLFAKLAPPYVTVHALVSRADFSAEAMKLSLCAGPDLEQVLAQVDYKSGLNADADLPLEQYTAGCTMLVPTDGMVFMILLTVPVGDKILYNLVTQMDD
ncbi:TPA: hypothetical protein ACH3X3_000010 [Trebouxia sp. C0006]